MTCLCLLPLEYKLHKDQGPFCCILAASHLAQAGEGTQEVFVEWMSE